MNRCFGWQVDHDTCCLDPDSCFSQGHHLVGPFLLTQGISTGRLYNLMKSQESEIKEGREAANNRKGKEEEQVLICLYEAGN